MIRETGIEVVACLEERSNTAVASVLRKPHIIADGPSWLSRLVVTAEGGTCRYADESVGLYVGLHHHVDDTCRKESAHRSSF